MENSNQGKNGQSNDTQRNTAKDQLFKAIQRVRDSDIEKKMIPVMEGATVMFSGRDKNNKW